MTYTKSIWVEHSHTTNQKLSFLDNLESLYTQSVSYIDSITHAASYYTEAECTSKYFQSSNDGHNSGLICSTLDGMSADQIIAAGSPSGVICWWSGSEASIPSGWLLCNGLNGTPDLRDRFVPGAGSHYSKGDAGGANIVTTTGTVTIAGHALTAGEIPKHTHGSITDYYPVTNSYNRKSGASGGTVYVTSIADNLVATGSTGGDGSHTHSASWDGTDDQDKRPPFYALCAIMKS